MSVEGQSERVIYVDGYGVIPTRLLCLECRGDGTCHHMIEFTLECCTCQGRGVSESFSSETEIEP